MKKYLFFIFTTLFLNFSLNAMESVNSEFIQKIAEQKRNEFFQLIGKKIFDNANKFYENNKKALLTKGNRGETLVHYAIFTQDLGVATFCLEKLGANLVDDFGTTSLHVAVFLGFDKLIRILLGNRFKIDLNAKTKNELGCCTALHLAVQQDNLEAVKLLLKAGANAKVKNLDQKTPLELAIELNNSCYMTLYTHDVNSRVIGQKR